MKTYTEERCKTYDEKSSFDKGDRERHYSYLEDVLSYYDKECSSIIELGCGTGFYTQCFLDLHPKAKLICVDGSEHMIKIFEKKFANRMDNIRTLISTFETLDLSKYNNIDICFAGVSLSCMAEHDRYKLISTIYNCLSDEGLFILFDQFKPENVEHAKLNAYLICKDMQRRMSKSLSIPITNPILSLDRLIKNEAASKLKDGDKESSIESNAQALVKGGFKSVQIIFQEPRLFGIVARKIEGKQCL